MKRVVILFLFLCGIVRSEDESVEDLIKGVVQIKVYTQEYNAYSPWELKGVQSSSGTGFIIQGKKIITNAHVVSNAKYIIIQKSNQSNWTKAEVQFIAHDCDLAVLSVKAENFFDNTFQFEIGGLPALNSTVTVLGYPIGGDKISVTRGIISRREQTIYSHSSIDSHLVLQVDAAINPGNSGGPAIQNKKVVGIAFQISTQGQNIGYLIPPNVINRMLKDIEDNIYDGYVELGIRTINSFNKLYRKYKKIPEKETGVFVTKIFFHSSAYNQLREGDFLLEIDGYKIGNDGSVSTNEYSNVDFIEIIDNKHKGDMVKIKIIREGKFQEINFLLTIMNDFEFMRKTYDKGYPYFIFGGMVFQMVNKDLLNAWSVSENTNGGSQFLYRYFYFLEEGLNQSIKNDVIFYRRIDHPLNSASEIYENLIVESVNGIKIHDLFEFKEIIINSKGKFIIIKFLDIELPLVVNRDEYIQLGKELNQTLGISND